MVSIKLVNDELQVKMKIKIDGRERGGEIWTGPGLEGGGVGRVLRGLRGSGGVWSTGDGWVAKEEEEEEGKGCGAYLLLALPP